MRADVYGVSRYNAAELLPMPSWLYRQKSRDANAENTRRFRPPISIR